MRHRTALPILLATSLILGACSSGASTGPGGTGPATLGPDRLDGRTFLSIAIDGHALVANSQIRLTFHGDQIGAAAGCNSMGGTYQLDGNVLHVGQLGTTDMACDPELMAQDTWVAALLDGATIALDGDTLTLTHGDVRVTLQDRETADPDKPLLGTRWVLDGIIAGDAVSSVPVGVAAAITFSGGRVDVEAGCNTGGGSVAISDATIAFGPIGLTKRACEADAMAVEQAVGAVLAGTVGYTIEAGVLTLDAGRAGLTFHAA